EHASMLIHVTRYNLVQKHVHRQVSEHLQRLKQRLVRRIGDEDIRARIRALWDRDFAPTTRAVRASYPALAGEGEPAWDGVDTALGETVEDIEVKIINGTAKDALDYTERRDTGAKVIAIGGDKLSRGLTLEGLSV